MWHRSIGSIAVSCSGRAVMPLLRTDWSFSLHTPQQKLTMFFNGPDNYQNCSFPWGFLSPSYTWFFEPTWVSPTNGISIASAVFFLHSTSVWWRHIDTSSPTFVAIGRIHAMHAAKYRSRRRVWSKVVRRTSDLCDTHRRTKLTAPETISRSRQTVGAQQNLNGSRDLTSPLLGVVCHPPMG